jgi:hypothetical protein
LPLSIIFRAFGAPQKELRLFWGKAKQSHFESLRA